MRLVLVMVVLCGVARADERDDAKREFAAGQTADKQHDYRAAIEHYLRAFELSPHPFALFNIAADYEQLGDLRQAVHFYEKYIAATEDNADRERVKKLLADLKARPGGLVVHSIPEGAQVFVDGKPVGTTPYTANARGGHHAIAVELEGQRLQKDISIDFGEPVTETFRMAGGSGTSAIQVTGAPFGAAVAIDNVPSGVLPVRVPEPPGEHTVTVTMQGFTPFETTAVVQPNAVTEVRAVLPRALDGGSGGRPSILVYYLVGAAGGADVRGNGGYGGVELGLHALQYDLLTTIGKTSGGSAVDFIIRYYLTNTRIAPFIGVGYSYIAGGGGYEITGGLRYDIVKGEHVGLTALLYYELRTFAGTDATDTNPMGTASGVFMPVAGSIEVLWR